MTAEPSPKVRAGCHAHLWILAAATAFFGLVLGLSIARTVHQEQDAAYYCEVVERHLRGEGFTSLADRRGPAEPSPWPQEFRAANYWPHVLSVFASVTGEAERTGAMLSLLSLIGAVWLATFAIHRALKVPLWLAAAVSVVVFSHRVAARAATLPETDSVSLLLNTACLFVLVLLLKTEIRRPMLWMALVGLTTLAILVRLQNMALAFPIAAVLLIKVPLLRTTVLSLGIVAGLLQAGHSAFEGTWQFLDPTERGSLVRTLRFLTIPALLGLVLARREAGLSPFLWLAFGHFLVILANPDPTSNGEFLFGGRHGLPMHLAAAAGAAYALAFVRGPARLVLAGMAVIASAENLTRPLRDMSARIERTSMPSLDPLIVYLRNAPNEDRVVLTWDSDVLAREARTKTVHLRGFEHVLEREGPDGFVASVRNRGVTHVALTWTDKSVLADFRALIDRYAAALKTHMQVEWEFDATTGGARTVLLTWK